MLCLKLNKSNLFSSSLSLSPFYDLICPTIFEAVIEDFCRRELGQKSVCDPEKAKGQFHFPLSSGTPQKALMSYEDFFRSCYYKTEV